MLKVVVTHTDTVVLKNTQVGNSQMMYLLGLSYCDGIATVSQTLLETGYKVSFFLVPVLDLF